jgi:hypothetical protein
LYDGVYAAQNEPMAANYGDLRAVTLEDIDRRVATFIGNGTRNG